MGQKCKNEFKKCRKMWDKMQELKSRTWEEIQEKKECGTKGKKCRGMWDKMQK